ncbi:hypothetical protein C5L31_001093 [Secundilactobacillus malefermentans]|uniref:Uncharacterized protein n=2 Tax=Secundilactobacillus malefermentans TaxID=176292 RepID=A0A4R5NFR0_9LACO|nr:hypothetical protein FD44_GL001862 [Secundilactobacillus malefermentans DSM 5705 = KCTC 3548]TDG72634.1 hypothetical protein C5L31_001093 [Secundilactobacillus malefermentans]
MTMMDVKKSLENLAWTTDHHFQHIQNQHEFIRAVAIQFELGYTDFRVIEMALQLSDGENHELLKQFATAYENVYQYEYAFVADGLSGFNEKFGHQMPAYKEAKESLLSVIQLISKLQPWYKAV